MNDNTIQFFSVAADLELAGLIWWPEIGDEITPREQPDQVSILFDSQGMTPAQLRNVYVWLPSIEQLVTQFEVRQAILEHVGLELSDSGIYYRSVVEHQSRRIEAQGETLRGALGTALRSMLLSDGSSDVH